MQYLRALCFSINEAPEEDDAEGEEFGKLIECYQYNFRYPTRGTVESSFEHTSSSARGKTEVDVKAQLAQMFRAVTTMCYTLPPTPARRMLSIKLFYYDDITPPDYQRECAPAARTAHAYTRCAPTLTARIFHFARSLAFFCRAAAYFEDSTNNPALPFTSVPETVMCGKLYTLKHGIGLKMHRRRRP